MHKVRFVRVVVDGRSLFRAPLSQQAVDRKALNIPRFILVHAALYNHGEADRRKVRLIIRSASAASATSAVYARRTATVAATAVVTATTATTTTTTTTP